VWCLIDGNPVAKRFAVEVSRTARVGILREQITTTYPGLFPRVSSIDLQLCKVNKNGKEMKDFVPTEAMSPVPMICDVFGEGLLEADDVVHVLVRGPGTYQSF